MKLLTVKQMVAVEKAADKNGHSYDQMMELAGKRTAEAIVERLDVAGKSVLVLVGPGNNGGDGLVAGRYLGEAGAEVGFYLYKSRSVDEDENFAKVQEMGLLTLEAEHDQRYRVLRTRLNITDILIDALLGTGVSRPIEGDLADLMKQVQAGLDGRQPPPTKRNLHPLTPSPHPLLAPLPPRPYITAVDCPSGLNSDSGELDPLTIEADLTVTYAAPKWGHFLFPGAGACGELVVADIGIDPSLPELQDVQVEVVTAEMAQSLLPKRPSDGHKGTFGKVAIGAGSEQYPGAPLLSARGAFRAGAGLVALWVPRALRHVAVGTLPEATCPILQDEETLGADTAERLLDRLDEYKAILIGPGLGEAGEFLRPFLNTLRDKEIKPPLVIDADGLNILAKEENWHDLLPANTILTPHPGEMARLMNISLDVLKTRNRIETARDCARVWGHVVLLKGAHTVVAAPDGRVRVLPFAAPVLAVGGSGDVLAGVTTSLRSQGMEAFETAVLAAYLHGFAGVLSGQDRGLLASEIADWVATAVAKLA